MRAAVLRIGLLAALFSAGILATAGAAPILTGTATIAFSGDFGGGPGSVSETDIVSIGAGPEIVFGDGSGIGTNVLLDFESLDLAGLTISYTIQGGSNVGAVQAGYGDNGMVAGTFSFSNLLFAPGTVITGFSTSLTNVIDPNNAVGAFSFTGNSLTMSGLEQLLILESAANTGIVRVTLQVRDGQPPPPPPPVPEPATLTLLGGGLALAAARRRLARA